MEGICRRPCGRPSTTMTNAGCSTCVQDVFEMLQGMHTTKNKSDQNDLMARHTLDEGYGFLDSLKGLIGAT